MKKAVSVLGAFCFGAFITIGVMACADDYSQVIAATQSASDRDVSEIVKYFESDYYAKYTFTYDDLGRISKINVYAYDRGYTKSSTCSVLYDGYEAQIYYADRCITILKFGTTCSIDLMNSRIIDTLGIDD